MKQLSAKNWGVGIGAALFATLALLPQAQAELVFEDDSTTSTQAVGAVQTERSQGEKSRMDDRASLRQAMSASEKAQATLSSQSQAPSTSVVQTAPAPVSVQNTQSAQQDFQNLTKAELMRRERVREELKNEDVLQERLEELRLRDERARTDQMLSAGATQAVTGPSGVSAAQAPVQTQMVASPVTEHPGVVAPSAPLVAAPGASANDSLSTSSANTTVASGSDLDSPEDNKTIISVLPKFGFGSMNASDAFVVHPRYAAGLSLGFGVSENVAAEFGYLYGEYGVAGNTSNPAVAYYQQYLQSVGGSLDTIAMKQNVFDLGVKFYLLDSESKIRPFIGAGGGYAKSYVNYDQKFLTYLRSINMTSADYEANSFLGDLSAGLDVKIAKNIAIDLTFKYYTIFSNQENGQLAYGAFAPGYGYATYPSYGAYSYQSDKLTEGQALAESSFYVLTGGVSFTF